MVVVGVAATGAGPPATAVGGWSVGRDISSVGERAEDPVVAATRDESRGRGVRTPIGVTMSTDIARTSDGPRGCLGDESIRSAKTTKCVAKAKIAPATVRPRHPRSALGVAVLNRLAIGRGIFLCLVCGEFAAVRPLSALVVTPTAPTLSPRYETRHTSGKVGRNAKPVIGGAASRRDFGRLVTNL
jgi:hypothetical protein